MEPKDQRDIQQKVQFLSLDLKKCVQSPQFYFRYQFDGFFPSELFLVDSMPQQPFHKYRVQCHILLRKLSSLVSLLCNFLLLRNLVYNISQNEAHQNCDLFGALLGYFPFRIRQFLKLDFSSEVDKM